MPYSSLKGERAFNRIRSGKTGSSSLVTVRWLPLRPKVVNPVRFGIVASKKVGKAVVRNLIRRRIKAVLHHLECPPCEAVVVVHPKAAEASFAELKQDLMHALKKSGLLKP